MTAGEHITALENKRAALTARMADILNASADDGATLEPSQPRNTTGLAAGEKHRRRSGALARSRKTADSNRGARRQRQAARVPLRASRLSRTCRSARSLFAPPAHGCSSEPACYGSGQNAVTYAEKRWNDYAGSRALPESGRCARHHHRCDVGGAAGQSEDHERFPRAPAAGDDSREDSRPAQSPVQRESPGAIGGGT